MKAPTKLFLMYMEHKAIMARFPEDRCWTFMEFCLDCRDMYGSENINTAIDTIIHKTNRRNSNA